MYGNTIDNVVAVLADNCSVNHSVARKFKISLVGCARHRYQLSVEYIIQEQADFISAVHSVKLQFRSPLYESRIRRKTDLKVKIMNDTRWISCYEMMRSDCELRGFSYKLYIAEVDVLLPSEAVDKKIDTLCKELSGLYGVTNALQWTDGTISSS